MHALIRGLRAEPGCLRGVMLRVLGFATLVLIAICLALGASIALADGTVKAAKAKERTIEAVDPDRRIVDDSLASAEGARDLLDQSRGPLDI
jgi:hypothetical protein